MRRPLHNARGIQRRVDAEKLVTTVVIPAGQQAEADRIAFEARQKAKVDDPRNPEEIVAGLQFDGWKAELFLEQLIRWRASENVEPGKRVGARADKVGRAKDAVVEVKPPTQVDVMRISLEAQLRRGRAAHEAIVDYADRNKLLHEKAATSDERPSPSLSDAIVKALMPEFTARFDDLANKVDRIASAQPVELDEPVVKTKVARKRREAQYIMMYDVPVPIRSKKEAVELIWVLQKTFGNMEFALAYAKEAARAKWKADLAVNVVRGRGHAPQRRS